MKFVTSLPRKDFQNLKYALSLGSDNFEIFYDNLDLSGQQYLNSLLITYKYDILDYAFMIDYHPSEDVAEIIDKLKGDEYGMGSS